MNKDILYTQENRQGKTSEQGTLAILRTKAEVEARFVPVEAFITPVRATRANVILRVIDTALREAQSSTTESLQHLRRFVKFEYLPSYLKNSPTRSSSGQSPGNSANSKHEREYNDGLEGIENVVVADRARLHLLICAGTDLTVERILSLVGPDGRSLWDDTETSISSIIVPGFPPSSEAQAQQWSQQYWPTIFRRHNPFGAHPALVSRATEKIKENVGSFMNLAKEAGQQASKAGIGESIGVVVVDRTKPGDPAVVMVSGDARWNLAGRNSAQINGNGNVLAHAVMRAISLVANRRQDLSPSPPTRMHERAVNAYADIPLTPLEQSTYSLSTIDPDGYLCLDFEFYLTHEPCVMCSMALLHSRAGKVIFEKQMERSGGLTAGVDENEAEHANSLGYGLFWRPSLNWKFLTWQWTRADGDGSPARSVEDMHA